MSEKFIVMRSSNLTAPMILNAANTYEEAYKVMIKDFVEIGEYRQPKIYSRYDFGAKAEDCVDCCSYYWSIEKVDFENKTTNNLTLEEQLPDEIVAVIYNWKGLKEENFLFTIDDFIKFVGDSEDADSLGCKINEMRNGEIEEFAFTANKTFSAWIIDKKKSEDIREDIYAFLNGKSNDNAMRMLLDNYDASLSPLENIEQWEDWYYNFNSNESSKKIVDVLMSNSIFCSLIESESTGGSIPTPSIDVLRDILDDFDKDSDEYKDISKTISDFDKLNWTE